MRNSYKYTKMYSGGEPVFTEADVFTIVIPLSEAATATVGPTIQDTTQVTVQDTTQVTTQDTTQVDTQDARQDGEDKYKALVEYCIEPKSKREMMRFLGLVNVNYFRKAYLAPLLETGRIVMTIPDKPTSRNQRYKKK